MQQIVLEYLGIQYIHPADNFILTQETKLEEVRIYYNNVKARCGQCDRVLPKTQQNNKPIQVQGTTLPMKFSKNGNK